MSSTSAPSTNDLALPVAAIVCISVVCYTLLIIGVLVLRWAIRRHNICENCCKCNLCGKEEPLECTCCVNVSQSCDCDPSLNRCLDKLCPNRKKMQQYWRERNVSCVDILLCQCFAGPNNCCTNVEKENDCCVLPCDIKCNHFNFCCFEVNLRTTTSEREHSDFQMMQVNSARSMPSRTKSGREPSTVVQVINI
ncbi:Hypothetical predicted protein [Mytilus galloprovincialis]|uniref:Uncharacterized protein n=1 Tax=Mytilus galloprovincialis TaxID=29158 RepID=A0A8B6D5I1_MYTGA|nr:Hypothetical predicted protein [Mytilus galloprovincialis]